MQTAQQLRAKMRSFILQVPSNIGSYGWRGDQGAKSRSMSLFLHFFFFSFCLFNATPRPEEFSN